MLLRHRRDIFCSKRKHFCTGAELLSGLNITFTHASFPNVASISIYAIMYYITNALLWWELCPWMYNLFHSILWFAFFPTHLCLFPDPALASDTHDWAALVICGCIYGFLPSVSCRAIDTKLKKRNNCSNLLSALLSLHSRWLLYGSIHGLIAKPIMKELRSLSAHSICWRPKFFVALLISPPLKVLVEP